MRVSSFTHPHNPFTISSGSWDLYRLDQLEITVIVFTADHGEMLGERGMWFKFNPYEQSIKVPLIVHVSGAPAARRVRCGCARTARWLTCCPRCWTWPPTASHPSWPTPLTTTA